MDKKLLRNDIILSVTLLLTAASAVFTILVTQEKTDLTAKVYVQNDLVESIDLSKKEDKYYYVKGLHTMVTIHTKDGGIAIVDGHCPHHDCENMGYVTTTNRPIICAYNAVYVEIVGPSYSDVGAG